MNRRKIVQGSVSSWFECEVHGWTFGEEDENDNCPVCYGEKLAEARIIELLESKCQCHVGMSKGYMVKKICSAHNHIALIKGEQK